MPNIIQKSDEQELTNEQLLVSCTVIAARDWLA